MKQTNHTPERKEPTYEEAIARLEAIAQELEQEHTGIDQMAERLKEAQQLIKLCNDRLTTADKQCQALLDSDPSEN